LYKFKVMSISISSNISISMCWEPSHSFPTFILKCVTNCFRLF
jgi:hypothetical protein